MPVIKEQRITRVVSKHGQAAKVTEIVEIRGRRFRIRLKSDSYDVQSYARIEVWNGDRWNLVHEIPGPAMETPHGLAYERWPDDFEDKLAAKFQNDRDELVLVAVAVVAPEVTECS